MSNPYNVDLDRTPANFQPLTPLTFLERAALLDTFLDRATIGVEQKRPMLTPGVINLADLPATARSQQATS